MVRRELYRLEAWITVFGADIVRSVDSSNLTFSELLQDTFRCEHSAAMQPFPHPPSQRSGGVKAAAAPAVQSSLDTGSSL